MSLIIVIFNLEFLLNLSYDFFSHDGFLMFLQFHSVPCGGGREFVVADDVNHLERRSESS